MTEPTYIVTLDEPDARILERILRDQLGHLARKSLDLDSGSQEFQFCEELLNRLMRSKIDG